MWDVRDYLIPLFATALFDAGLIEYERWVLDGPPPRTELPKRFVLVGAATAVDDPATADDSWGRLTSEPDPAWPGWRLELGEIDCVAVAWSGSTRDQAEVRTVVSDMVQTCQKAVIDDRKLGGLLTGEFEAMVSRLSVRDPHTDRGPFAEVQFTVEYGQRAVFSS